MGRGDRGITGHGPGQRVNMISANQTLLANLARPTGWANWLVRVKSLSCEMTGKSRLAKPDSAGLEPGARCSRMNANRTARITTAKPPQTSQRTVREYDSILTKKVHSAQSAPESSIRASDAQALSSVTVAVVAVGFSEAGFFFSTSALYHSFHAASSTTFTAPFMRAWPSPQSWAQVIW